ncbi:hybrid signal transduction histidine kinase B-like [Haliotis rufescens]|uniref:hybrid signal transduction histidine kinase B-like n=1 Tax=Haliotis rufescens TaxID=6454 RepID=UPI00201E77AC|nr:hybrid signal transduction histidine kinase B-like [Haliotis rufescens]
MAKMTFDNPSQLSDYCGVCGDRKLPGRTGDNVAGGKYALGIIVASYVQGSVIDVTVKLTANHRGFFEFRLCPHNNPNVVVSQDCLDNNRLHIVRVTREDGSVEVVGGPHFSFTEDTNFIYIVTLRLPSHISCTQCILQWHYKAAQHNNLHLCNYIGCGDQEHYVNCADVEITPLTNTSPTTTSPTTSQTTSSTTSLTTTSPTTTLSPTTSVTTSHTTSETTSATSPTSTSLTTPTTTTTSMALDEEIIIGNKICNWANPDLVHWPKHPCNGICELRCSTHSPGFHSWCMNNCAHDPPFCPLIYCNCQCKYHKSP